MKTTAFQRRTLRAVERAHFDSIQSEFETECLTYCVDDAELKTAVRPLPELLTDETLVNEWVN